MGLKCSDFHTAPLCRRCHNFWHAQGTFPAMSRDRAERLLFKAMAQHLAKWVSDQLLTLEGEEDMF